MKLDERTRELIAVGSSVSANCQPCLQYHVGKALAAGAAREEIAEAIAMGQTVRKGAASKMDRFIAELAKQAPANASASDDSCGCTG